MAPLRSVFERSLGFRPTVVAIVDIALGLLEGRKLDSLDLRNATLPRVSETFTMSLALTHYFVQVCIFYLVLRGLDTIEDDMTLPDEKKQPLLRQFHKLAVKPDWTFDECGPNEKDRQLLVEWTNVSEELNRLDAWCVSPFSVFCREFS